MTYSQEQMEAHLKCMEAAQTAREEASIQDAVSAMKATTLFDRIKFHLRRLFK